ncbi:hypothetical protein K439DRAFT_1657304 [Ramaria rubella]|nr:hypothetical protein K439DRAFT_1657304 [Ramaria rubella]
MPSITSWLSDISRRKLRVAASGHDGLRDTINLRRFVLLKNSISQAESPAPPQLSPESSLPKDDHVETLVFPDVCSVSSSLSHISDTPPGHDTEEKWLESVLETLEDEFDGEVEVEVLPVEDDDDDIDFLDSSSSDSFASWAPQYDGLAFDDPLPFSPNHTFSRSAVLSSTFQPPTSRQLFFDSQNSHFNQLFVEPRYPEADFDLPISETSSDSETDDDDDGPSTPFSGSEHSLGGRGTVEPGVYVEHDSYFLYPSELDLISPPIFYQQC